MLSPEKWFGVFKWFVVNYWAEYALIQGASTLHEVPITKMLCARGVEHLKWEIKAKC